MAQKSPCFLCVFKCCERLSLLLNFLSQNIQANGLSVEWTDRMCLFKCSLRLKALGHSLHLKGLASSSAALIGVIDLLLPLHTFVLLLFGIGLIVLLLLWIVIMFGVDLLLLDEFAEDISGLGIIVW